MDVAEILPDAMNRNSKLDVKGPQKDHVPDLKSRPLKCLIRVFW